MTKDEYDILQKKMWEILDEEDSVGWKSDDWNDLEDYVKEKLILQLAGVERTYDDENE